ncbi:restriction endonuclease subunit S [Vibrio fluvialis]|nr:restriction endonuclease subunit S [Vibrio fluvialis]
MGKYQAFSEYKYSNNEFLGKVPSHWVMGRFKFCTTRVVVGIAEAATHAYSDFGVPIIRSTNIKEKCLDTTRLLYIKDSFAEQNSSKYLYENDIVTIRTGFPGISAVVPSSLDKSQCFTNLISTPKKSFNPKFLTYFLNSSSGKAYFELLGWGSAQKNISVPILQDFPLAHPLIDEQTQIANFLDHETAKIDTLIEKQQQLIKLLKEKRQAVISHAVTKGLNPQAPMKDSGVEWLGEVPEHWGVSQLKYDVNPNTSITYGIVQAGPHIEDGIPYIKTSDMSGDELPLDGYSKTSVRIDAAYKRSKVFEGDIVVAIRASVGKSLLVPKNLDGANLTQGTAKISCGLNMLPKFLLAYLNSVPVQGFFSSISKGATFKEITLDSLRRLPTLVPPLPEQEKLAQYIGNHNDIFMKLIKSAEIQVSLLKERRVALISAAVTGKIDVRNWQAPTSQNQALEQTA